MTRDDLDADVLHALRRATRTRQAFYVLVLAVALIGQVTGAAQALGIPLAVAVPAVATLELGGVVVMADADVRRRLGERALASRLLSAAIAAAAVTFNWTAHPDHLLGGFYAGMSALGYLVWLIHAGNQRRDRLRATGNLPPTPPAYELVGHWIRHPALTLRARTIAKADGLDLYESLTEARTAIDREYRNTAIARLLQRKIRANLDPTTADIAVRVYDLDEIADRLTAAADYHGLTTLLATDLTPERMIGANALGRRRRRWRKRLGHADMPRVAEISESHPLAVDAQADGGREPQPPPERESEPTSGKERHPPAGSHDAVPPPPSSVPPLVESAAAHPSGRSESGTDVADGDEEAEVPRGTAEAVAYWLRREPNMDPELLAEKDHCVRCTGICRRTTLDDRESRETGRVNTLAPCDVLASVGDARRAAIIRWYNAKRTGFSVDAQGWPGRAARLVLQRQ
ncbi:hypothetical protein FJK98_32020 [Micromonospora sp. HM134]|uniref:hypothetical protein n=1 Tax=Micromonospora sp. HM134 TaxID=2583243 RepID=UPI001198B9AC|nr:hypothetical protein [Micromonospora sp. HM134]QDY11196.1 hypothetical protein FJK98_32020 [Micromonospora sp. HM134]